MGVLVAVGVFVAVDVLVAVGVLVDVPVGIGVAVGVGVTVGVAVGEVVGVVVDVVAGKLLSMMVPTPSLSAMPALDAPDKTILNVRLPCLMVRFSSGIETVLLVCPGLKVTVPL